MAIWQEPSIQIHLGSLVQGVRRWGRAELPEATAAVSFGLMNDKSTTGKSPGAPGCKSTCRFQDHKVIMSIGSKRFVREFASTRNGIELEYTSVTCPLCATRQPSPSQFLASHF